MNKNSYIIRYADYNDLDEIAKIHKESYPEDHFLNQLSLSLINKFYKSFLKYPNIFLVCIKCKKICGFILGLESYVATKAKYDFIKENQYELVVYVIYKIFSIKFILKFLPRFINLVKDLLFKSLKQGNTSATSEIFFTLLSIAVSSEVRGRGVANILLDDFEKKLKEEDVKKYMLSVRKNNLRAINFYKKKSFYIDKENKTEIHMCKLLI
jgi:ribosomal protein S18 acetylase RimI-like enzyme